MSGSSSDGLLPGFRPSSTSTLSDIGRLHLGTQGRPILLSSSQQVSQSSAVNEEDDVQDGSPARKWNGREASATPKSYPALPKVYIETEEEIEAKARAMGIYSSPRAVPPPTTASAPSASPPALPTMTQEQRQRMEFNRQKALDIRLKREAEHQASEASLAAERVAAEAKVKKEKFEQSRKLGQASLEKFGVSFQSHRKPARDFRVPLAEGEEARRKQEERKAEIVALREEMQEKHRREMQKPAEEFKPDPQCSPEQIRILNEVRAGRNVFFTGSAGTGKSFVLNELVRMLEADRRAVAVTAPTGIAAVNISGQTFHSAAKVGLGQGSVHTLYNKIMQGQAKAAREAARDGKQAPAGVPLVTNQVIIVDEISMLAPDLFERVSVVAKALRHDPRPFGGLQVILSGDFFQLPPVQKDDNVTCPYCGSPGFERNRADKTLRCIAPMARKFDGIPCGKTRKEHNYCFETPTWRELGLTVVQLGQVFRQDNAIFVAALNKVRRGEVDDETDRLFAARSAPLGEHKISPTNLYPKKNDVSSENLNQFKLLDEEPMVFESHDLIEGPYAHNSAERLNKDVQAPKRLELKVGAQVLLLANLDVPAGLVNGSRGVVIDWQDINDRDSHPEARNLVARAGRERDEDFHRATNLEWRSRQGHSALPVVLFANGSTVIVNPHTWAIEIDRDNYLARTQLPLALAWAMTCHKSQGQSLDRLIVNLRGVFERGQTYVSLSRARTLEGLQVVGWSRSAVRTDSLVREFYDALDEGKPFGDQSVPFPVVEDFFPPGIVALLTHGEHWRPPVRQIRAPLVPSVAVSAPPPIPDKPVTGSSMYGILPASLERMSADRVHIAHGLPTPGAGDAPPPVGESVDAVLADYWCGVEVGLDGLATKLGGRPGWDVDGLKRHMTEAMEKRLRPVEPALRPPPPAGSGGVKREAPDPVKLEDAVKLEEGAVSVPEQSGKRRRRHKKKHH